MAENTRVRLEPDIESYLKSQAERVLGKSGDSHLAPGKLNVYSVTQCKRTHSFQLE
jgi:hypothetical protein